MEKHNSNNQDMAEIFETDLSCDAVDELCKQSLLTLSVCGDYIATRPIYNKAGVLLLKQDEKLGIDKRNLILKHELRDRFLNCVANVNEVGLNKIPAEINDLFKTTLSDLKGSFKTALHDLNTLIQDADFSNPAQTTFALLKERHPSSYHHAFLAALIMIQMANLKGYDQQHKVVLFTAGLFHHLGYGTLETSDVSSAFLNLNPTEQQNKVIRVHPLWTYKLLDGLNQIAKEDNHSDVFMFPDAALEGILRHHRGVDGIAGYGGTGIPNETARMLYVVDTFIVLLQTGLTTQGALMMIKKHAGKAPTHSSSDQSSQVYSMRQDIPEDSSLLFDEQSSALLAAIFTAPISIPIQKPIQAASEIPHAFIRQLFVDFNRLCRELGELRNNVNNCCTRFKDNDRQMRALRTIEMAIQRMIQAVIKESGLFGVQIDQLEFVGIDQAGQFMVAIQPVFFELEQTMGKIKATIARLIAQEDETGEEKIVRLRTIQTLSYLLSKVISEVYDRYLEQTRMRRLENVA